MVYTTGPEPEFQAVAGYPEGMSDDKSGETMPAYTVGSDGRLLDADGQPMKVLRYENGVWTDVDATPEALKHIFG